MIGVLCFVGLGYYLFVNWLGDWCMGWWCSWLGYWDGFGSVCGVFLCLGLGCG